MLDLSDVGQILKEARTQIKMTQSDLAEASGVSRSTIDALENGRMAELGFNKVMRLMGIVGLDLRPTTMNRGRPTLDDLLDERARDPVRNDPDYSP